MTDKWAWMPSVLMLLIALLFFAATWLSASSATMLGTLGIVFMLMAGINLRHWEFR